MASHNFELFTDDDQLEYNDGDSVLVTCDGDSNPTMNREKVGAVCKCSDGQCDWESKKADFKCIPDWKCPLPDFQGAKFNYVIDAEKGDDWAYMRFRFRPDFTKGDQSFWDESEWTGIIACPFSSTTDVASPVEGIYFTGGSSGMFSLSFELFHFFNWFSYNL